jgi:excisionase family DNA binding protein
MHTHTIASPASPTDIPQLAFTVPEAARAFRVSRGKLYLEMATGRLRSFTIGTRRRISAAALSEYVAARESTASPLVARLGAERKNKAPASG